MWMGKGKVRENLFLPCLKLLPEPVHLNLFQLLRYPVDMFSHTLSGKSYHYAKDFKSQVAISLKTMVGQLNGKKCW